jgi:hypothetical protein
MLEFKDLSYHEKEEYMRHVHYGHTPHDKFMAEIEVRRSFYASKTMEEWEKERRALAARRKTRKEV